MQSPQGHFMSCKLFIPSPAVVPSISHLHKTINGKSSGGVRSSLLWEHCLLRLHKGLSVGPWRPCTRGFVLAVTPWATGPCAESATQILTHNESIVWANAAALQHGLWFVYKWAPADLTLGQQHGQRWPKAGTRSCRLCWLDQAGSWTVSIAFVFFLLLHFPQKFLAVRAAIWSRTAVVTWNYPWTGAGIAIIILTVMSNYVTIILTHFFLTHTLLRRVSSHFFHCIYLREFAPTLLYYI